MRLTDVEKYNRDKKLKLTSLYNLLEDIGNEFRSSWSVWSEAEHETVESDIVPAQLENCQVLQDVEFHELLAFFIAKQLCHTYKSSASAKTLDRDFKYFKIDFNGMVLEQLDNPKKLNILANWIFSQYVFKVYHDVRVSPAQIEEWLNFFRSAYKKATELLVHQQMQRGMVEKDEDLITLQAALMLQHINMKFDNALPSLVDLQNFLVSEGLYLGSKKHRLFQAGAQCSIVTILRQDIAEVIACYLSDKIIRHFIKTIGRPLDNPERKKIIEELHFKIFSVAEKYRERKKTLLRQCSLVLHEIQESYLFDGVDMCRWIWGLSHIIDGHTGLVEKANESMLVRPPINAASTASTSPTTMISSMLFATMAPSTTTIRIYLLGDSVSAGFGIPIPEERWVNILQRTLNESLQEKLQGQNVVCEIINRSIVGYEVKHAAERLQTIQDELNVWKPDVVIGTAIGNDLYFASLKDTSKEMVRREVFAEMRRNLHNVIDECRREPSVREIIWTGGIPETIKVAAEFKTEFGELMTALKTEKQIETALLSDGLLEAKNFQADGLHFKKEAQESIAIEAFLALSPIVETIVEKKKAEAEPKVQAIARRSFVVGYQQAALTRLPCDLAKIVGDYELIGAEYPHTQNLYEFTSRNAIAKAYRARFPSPPILTQYAMKKDGLIAQQNGSASTHKEPIKKAHGM